MLKPRYSLFLPLKKLHEGNRLYKKRIKLYFHSEILPPLKVKAFNLFMMELTLNGIQSKVCECDLSQRGIYI